MKYFHNIRSQFVTNLFKQNENNFLSCLISTLIIYNYTQIILLDRLASYRPCFYMLTSNAKYKKIDNNLKNDKKYFKTLKQKYF